MHSLLWSCCDFPEGKSPPVLMGFTFPLFWKKEQRQHRLNEGNNHIAKTRAETSWQERVRKVSALAAQQSVLRISKGLLSLQLSICHLLQAPASLLNKAKDSKVTHACFWVSLWAALKCYLAHVKITKVSLDRVLVIIYCFIWEN